MSNEQAPECCPFCGAEVSVHNGHKRSNGEYAVYRCGTWIDVTLKNKIGSRAVDCWIAERERLTRERDEAKKAAETAMVELGQVASSRRDLLTRIQRLEAAHTNALNQIGDLCMENTNLLARVKRLEGESESRWLLAQSAIGSCAEMSSRIKRLEEALQACAAIIGPRDKVTWATDEQVDHAWELYTKAKEATR